MARIEGLEKVIAAMRKKAASVNKSTNVSVVVGYTAAHALWVHESREPKHAGEPRRSGLGNYWGPHGRPGFLLDVMREMMTDLRDIIVRSLKAGQTMAQSLLMAGLRLQRESQRNVPVEYGNLRASAFTRLENGPPIQAG
jgi:hypothetical protein